MQLLTPPKTTLVYNCTCSNGSAPDLAAYTNTIPYYICTTSADQCITANPNDAEAQSRCTTEIRDLCGTLDPASYTAAASSSSSSSAAASSTSAAASTTSATSATSVVSSAVASATAKGAAIAVKVGKEYGAGVIAAGAMAAFGYML